MILILHALFCNGDGIIFQFAIVITHIDLSQNHIGKLTGVSVFGGNRRRKCPRRRLSVLFQLSGIDQSHAVCLFSFAQPVVNSQCDVKILRLHQNIKTLGIQITLYRIPPLFIRNFQ